LDKRKALKAICEGLIIYGLFIVAYGIYVIHVAKTWYGDWHVDRYLDWLTLDLFMMLSFAVSFGAFMLWRYLKYTDPKK